MPLRRYTLERRPAPVIGNDRHGFLVVFCVGGSDQSVLPQSFCQYRFSFMQRLRPDVRNGPRATRTLLDLFFGIPNVALQVDWISRRAQTELDCVMALQHVSIENADLLLHEVSFIVSQPDIRL